MSREPDTLWASLTPDAAGLVTAVVQHAETDQVLMVGHMSREALAASLENRRVTFWSRSRQALWEKGETSGNVLALVEIRVDCDGDAILVKAIPAGPTCHTGTTSCFFRLADPGDADPIPEDDGPPALAVAVLRLVFAVIEDRKAGRGMTNREGKSYVRSLLDKGAPKIGEKLREEADELAQALAAESDDRVASEAADVLFHLLVGLSHRDLDPDVVAEVLARRFGVSGIDEKASR